MDQRLLAALENLGTVLEEIASALESKQEAKSSSVQALQSGDFGKQLQSINTQLKSIKADTQEILKQQKTIPAISKEKESKKDAFMEDIGKDKKKESALKKGIGTILLIAVAVLAIGMAFKLVGKIDFISVIALGLAIWVVAQAFEKVARLKLSLREAMVASLTMVTMSIAITMSSWILRMIVPVGMIQLLTAGAIAGMFAIIGMSLEKLAIGIVAFHRILGTKNLWAVPLIMVAIATAVTMSSWVMSAIVPIGMLQALTAIAISVVFAIIGLSLQRIATAILLTDKILGKKATWIFPLVLVAVATAITMSSWIMQLIVPIGLLQALTAIAISAIFMIIGFTMVEIATAIVLIDKLLNAKKAAWLLPLVLVAIATAITLSSWILQLVAPIGLFQFLTALGIAILFAVMSYFFVPIALGVTVIDKIVGKGASLLIPLIFVALSLAIMLSSHILAMTAKMDPTQILNIVLFGIGLGLVVLAMLPAVLLVGIAAVSGVGAGAIALGVLMVPLIAAAVAISSHIIAMGKYTKYPSLGWVLAVGLAMTGFGAAVVGLGFIALTGLGLGAAAIMIGTLMVPLIAKTIVKTDSIISKGKYNKYPGLGWIASVGTSMTLFGAAVVGLGILSITGLGLGALAIIIGTKMVPKIAQTIVDVDKIISKGKYNKYPGAEWIASVGITMTGFGAAVVALGILSIQGMGLGALAIIIGTKMVPKIAQTIVDVDKIISKGKYTKYPDWKWILSVGTTMTGFGAAVVSLGILAITGFGLGAVAIVAGTLAVPLIAKTIVAVDKIIAGGKYDKYPGWQWAVSVGSLMTVFGLSVLTLGGFIVGSLGLGYVALKAGQSAVKIIAQSIVDVAWIFNKSSAAFKKGPTKEWAEGVAISLGAFAPIYKMMMKGGIMTLFTGVGPSPKQFAQAIKTISQGIVDAAWFFAGAKVAFTGGPKKEWSEGVGKAIGAFAPVYKILMEQKGLFGTGVSIYAVKKGIKAITYGIVESAKIFSKNKAQFDNYPSVKWASGVSKAIGAFSPVIKTLMKSEVMEGATKVSLMISSIRAISSAIVFSAKKFGEVKNWLELSEIGVPSKKWSWKVKNALQSFSRTARTLKASQKEIWRTQNIARGLAGTAQIFWKNRKAFDLRVSDDVYRWGNYLLRPNGIFYQFMNLTKWLNTQEKSMNKGALGALGEGLLAVANPVGNLIMKATGASSKSTGDIVADTALRMVRVARILFQGRKFFKLDIDPNYMKKVGKNMLDFNFIVKKLAEAEDSKGFLESMGDSINGLFGNDPISKIARRMVTLAGAYDKLATALLKLGGAMKVLNISDARMLGGITRAIADGRSVKEGGPQPTRPMAAVRSEITRVKEGIGRGAGPMNKDAEKERKLFKRMDEILKVLKNIDRSVASVDEFISDQSEGKYPSSGGQLF